MFTDKENGHNDHDDNNNVKMVLFSLYDQQVITIIVH